jgi:hypothetical protein
MEVIVVVPDRASAEFAKRELNAPWSSVVVTRLRSVGIEGTPTVAVLSPEHRVLHLWTGALPPALQEAASSQAISSLHILSEPDISQITIVSAKGTSRVSGDDSSGKALDKMTEDDLSKWLKETKTRTLDISTRDVFARTGRPSSINIPFDEVSVRARYELDNKAPWVIDCSQVDAAQCDMSSYLLRKEGFNSLVILDRGAVGAFCQTTPAK